MDPRRVIRGCCEGLLWMWVIALVLSIVATAVYSRIQIFEFFSGFLF